MEVTRRGASAATRCGADRHEKDSQAWVGSARLGWIWQGWARPGSSGWTWRGGTWQVLASRGRPGGMWRGMTRCGKGRLVGDGEQRTGRDKAWPGKSGWARPDWRRLVSSDGAGPAQARLDAARLG